MSKNILSFIAYLIKDGSKTLSKKIIKELLFYFSIYAAFNLVERFIGYTPFGFTLLTIIALIFFGKVVYSLGFLLHGNKYRSLFPDTKEEILTEMLKEMIKRGK